MRTKLYAAAVGTLAALAPLSFSANAPLQAGTPLNTVCAQEVCVCGCISTWDILDNCFCFGENRIRYICNLGCGEPCPPE